MSLKTTVRQVLAVSLLALASVSAWSAGEVAGTWSMTTRLGEREIPATMTLTQDGGGALHGQWVSQGREMELRNITIEVPGLTEKSELTASAPGKWRPPRSGVPDLVVKTGGGALLCDCWRGGCFT